MREFNWFTMHDLIDIRRRKFLANYILSEVYYVKWLQMCVVYGNCIRYCHVVKLCLIYSIHIFSLYYHF